MVRLRLRSIQLAFSVLAFLSAALHLLIQQEGEVENDISRYIRKQPTFQAGNSSITLRSYSNLSTTSFVRPGVSKETNTHLTYSGPVSDSGRKHVQANYTNSLRGETKIEHDVYHPASVSDFERKHAEKKSTLSSPPKKTKLEGTHMYWNLSCPLELSMFSGAHMGGDYLKRAHKARDLAKEVASQLDEIDWKSLSNRRIFFVGDSLLRQVFISMACMNWNRVTNYAVPWFEQRSVRTRQPNTIGKGPHSKFEEGRVQMQGNIELIYHHGIGNLLELGSEYQSHDPDSWIKACYLKKPFTTVTPKFQESGYLSTLNVQRESLILKPRDIVLINASVHAGRSFNLQNIADLFRCKKQMKHPDKSWPTMLYIMTGPSHFPTDTGAFEEELLEKEDDYNCRLHSTFHGYQDDEVRQLNDHLPMLGKEILDLEFQSGDLHVGGKDCLHWLQPGIPDLVAANITNFIASMAEK
jgi:hypothetical protein